MLVYSEIVEIKTFTMIGWLAERRIEFASNERLQSVRRQLSGNDGRSVAELSASSAELRFYLEFFEAIAIAYSRCQLNSDDVNAFFGTELAAISQSRKCMDFAAECGFKELVRSVQPR